MTDAMTPERKAALLDLLARVEKAEGPIGRAWREHINAAKDGCWLWVGRGADSKGRGRITVGGAPRLAHRVFWEFWFGEIPTGKFLCHHCDVPGCVRPDHIYVGDHASNMRDMTERKRFFAALDPARCAAAARQSGLANTWAKGARNPKAKLSGTEIAAIRQSKEPTSVLAATYLVHRTTIQRIRGGKLWADPPPRRPSESPDP